MLPPSSVALAMVVMVVFWAAMQWWQESHTCPYCGAYRGHEESCPYNL